MDSAYLDAQNSHLYFEAERPRVCHQDVCGWDKEKGILLPKGLKVDFAKLNHLRLKRWWDSVRLIHVSLTKNASMSVHIRFRDTNKEWVCFLIMQNYVFILMRLSIVSFVLTIAAFLLGREPLSTSG